MDLKNHSYVQSKHINKNKTKIMKNYLLSNFNTERWKGINMESVKSQKVNILDILSFIRKLFYFIILLFLFSCNNQKYCDNYEIAPDFILAEEQCDSCINHAQSLYDNNKDHSYNKQELLNLQQSEIELCKENYNIQIDNLVTAYSCKEIKFTEYRSRKSK